MTSPLRLDVGERRLPSGLTLLAVRNPGATTFACGVVLRADCRNETAAEAGLSNLVGDCLDEGTTKRSGDALAEAIENLGGGLEGNTSGAMVWCPAAAAAKALPLLVEATVNPAFPAKEVARVRDEVLAEIIADADDPRTVAALRFRAIAYGKHPFARPMKGSARTVKAFKPADLRRFHGRWFVPDGGYVAAAGPMPTEQTLDLLAKAFGSFQRAGHARPDVVEPLLPMTRTSEHISMPREQVHVFLGHVGVRRKHPDYYALQVMDHVLGSGSGFTSRVPKKLRDEQGLCYSVFAGISNSAGEEPGTFTAYIGTSTEHRQKAIDVFLAEIERLRVEPPTLEEVADVQAYLTGSFALGLDRNVNLLRHALIVRKFELGADYIERYPALIRAVTPADVQRVAATHLRPDRVAIVSAGAG